MAVAFLAFTAATMVLTAPLWRHPTRYLPSDLVDTLLNTWILGWDADRIRHGLKGIWDAPIFFPYHNTLAFSENLLGLAIFVAPVAWITRNPVFTYNVAFTFSFVLAGVGMYILAVTLLRSRRAAAVAATFYAFCPFRFMHISHVQLVNTGWLPIALWALHRYLRGDGRGWLAGFAAAFWIQALSNTYVAYFMMVPAGVIAVDALIRNEMRWQRCLELGAAMLLTALTLAPVALHYVQVRVDYGQVRRRVEMQMGSADVRDYLSGDPTIGAWRWLPAADRMRPPERDLFPGVTVLILAAAATLTSVRKRRFRRWVAVYGIVAIAAAALSLGPELRVWDHLVTVHAPYEWLLKIVPGMDGMRVPARFALVVSLGLSVLAGAGAEILTARLRPGLRTATVAACIALFCAESLVVPMRVQAYDHRGRPEERAIAGWLRTRPAGGVLNLPVHTFNFQELNYEYATLLHGHPIVNGMSGYDTPLQIKWRDESVLFDGEPPAEAVRMLRLLGIRYVVVNVEDYNVTQREAREDVTATELLRASGQVVAEHRFLEVYAFELAPPIPPPPTPEPVTRIDPRHLKIAVSEAHDRAAALTDGDPDTRWFGDQSASWIAVTLPQASDVARIELTLADRSLNDYPRRLQVDATDATGSTTTIARVMPYAEFMLGFVRDPHYPRIALTLPPNRTVTLTLRAVADAPGRWWSVHELSLWRRR